MADAKLQTILQAHGITASPQQLAGYLTELVEAMKEGALTRAAEELSEAELAVLRSGGFDVDAGSASQEDPIGRAAAAYPRIPGLCDASCLHENSPGIALEKRGAGAIPAYPSFHRALSDQALRLLLRNAAVKLNCFLL